MAENVFSAARLRAYRILEEAGLGDAVDLLILNTQIAGHLWLPLSLIEIAFRNAVDTSLTAAHPRGANWLLAEGDRSKTLEAHGVAGPDVFHSRGEDGTIEDPIATAARMASQQLSRDEILRDDLIAHLMLGFWVVRVPRGLASSTPSLKTFELVAGSFDAPLNHAPDLERVMVDTVLPMRNRVAHHESVVLRPKHVIAKKTAQPKTGADLVTSLLSAVEKFSRQVDVVLQAAETMAPMAAAHVGRSRSDVLADLAPLETLLNERRDELRRLRDERRSKRR